MVQVYDTPSGKQLCAACADDIGPCEGYPCVNSAQWKLEKFNSGVAELVRTNAELTESNTALLKVVTEDLPVIQAQRDMARVELQHFRDECESLANAFDDEHRERVRLQRQVEHAEHDAKTWESLAKVQGSRIHDLNNDVTRLRLNVQLDRETLDWLIGCAERRVWPNHERLTSVCELLGRDPPHYADV